jgi:cbb3-type cytochrome oxidase subunit 1
MKSMMMVRGIGGTMMLVGQLFFAYNVWKTVRLPKVKSADRDLDSTVTPV